MHNTGRPDRQFRHGDRIRHAHCFLGLSIECCVVFLLLCCWSQPAKHRTVCWDTKSHSTSGELSRHGVDPISKYLHVFCAIDQRVRLDLFERRRRRHLRNHASFDRVSDGRNGYLAGSFVECGYRCCYVQGILCPQKPSRNWRSDPDLL